MENGSGARASPRAKGKYKESGARASPRAVWDPREQIANWIKTMNEQSNQSPKTPARRHPAHPPPVRRHNTPVILHVTVCMTDRRPLLLARDAVHDALHTAWDDAQAWVVGYYLVMPDHIHLFCAPGDHAPPTVKAWTKYWKPAGQPGSKRSAWTVAAQLLGYADAVA